MRERCGGSNGAGAGRVRPTGDRPTSGRPTIDRPRSDRPTGDRPTSDRPTGDRPTSDRYRRARLAALAALPLLLVLGPAAAPASAATTVGVAGAYDGTYVPGRPVAVRVQVTADRLLQGRLEVVVSDGTPVGVAVEVPGGSTKEFLVVVPGSQSFNFDGALAVQARIRDGSTDIAAGNGVIQSSVGQELVGLLPAALGGRGLPGPTALAVDAGTARFAAIGPAELAQAPASLGPVSTIAAAADELMRLPGSARSAVLTWLEQGGHLLVDADPGQTVEGLPPAWQPGQDGRAPAGRGEVRLTGGAIADGRWAGLVEPTGWALAGNPEFGMGFGGGFVGQALAEEAGLEVPRLGWLVAFLFAYVVVAGPLLFFVVRRRGRPELAWVAVPLVAVLFTAGSYAGGRGLRDTTRQVDANIISTGAGGSTANTWLGVFSAGGQTSRVRFGPGWMPVGDPNSGASSLSSLTITPDGTEASLPLEAGQFGVVPSSGPAAVEGSLEVTATALAGEQASGRVKNTTEFALDDVAVFVGTGGALVGRLGPGEEREWTVTNTDLNFAFEGGPPAEFRVWGPGNFDGFSSDDTFDLTLWEAARQIGGQEFRGPGEVVAAGWTRSFTPPVGVDGRRAGGGRSLVLGRTRMQTPAEGGALDVRREVVRAPDFRRGKGDSFVVRFITRDADVGGRTPDPSRLTVRAPVGQLETWRDGGWRTVDPVALQELERSGWAEFVLPPSSVQGDIVYVRFPAFGPGVDSNGLFTLRERA